MAKPDYSVYTVIKKDGREDYWLNIGAAFAHGNGEGYNVLLQALPIDGKLVLRKYVEKKDEQPPPEQDEPKRKEYENKSRGR